MRTLSGCTRPCLNQAVLIWHGLWSCQDRSVADGKTGKIAYERRRLETHEEFCGCCFEGLEERFDSVKAIGSMEVGVTCQEHDVRELDEYAEELQNVFDNISGVRLDPELLSASRKVEIDFMNRLNVYHKRPRSWATDKGRHVIPTKCVDVNKGDAKRPEYQSRLCGKELKRWDPTMPGTFASMGPECVMFILSKARAHCQAEATNEMAIEWLPEEQVKGESLSGDDFIITGDSMQLAWIESPLNEGSILERRAVLGPDDGDDKTVTILNRLDTWVCLPGSRNQIVIETEPRHREILLAQMNLDGANVKSVTTPVKMQEWTSQMLTKIDKGPNVDIQKGDDAREVHVHQPRGCAAGGEGCGTFHGRAERGSTGHARASGPILRGSRQARASDLRKEVLQGAARGY